MMLWTDVIGATFLSTDMLPKLFHGGFFLTSWSAVTGVTLAIMLVLLSVTRKVANREKMF
jgi:hypothetical protein